MFLALIQCVVINMYTIIAKSMINPSIRERAINEFSKDL